MQDISNLRDKSIEELSLLSVDLSKQIYRMRNELKISRKLDKPHLLKHLKKDRARVLTIISEKTYANK
ncbi:MAG: 50S ribosomal protein L29 [Chlamydiae bacterium]|nr:50S ribosomal protein L29 [Chlamydiota bacterium]